MLRLLLPILLLIFCSCNQKTSDSVTLTSCELERQEGLHDFEKGTLCFVNGQFPLRYESELKALLGQKGIKYKISGVHGEDACYGSVMDSLIKVKFGDDFITKLESAADSLFYERNKNGVFDYSDVDTWALRENNNYHLGGDFIINYLNDNLPSKSTYRFVSNIVDRPHYLIAFTVDKNGQTKNIEIRERNGIEKFPGTEELIIKEVGKIKGWTPATIRNQPVTATFQMGVAIESGQ